MPERPLPAVVSEFVLEEGDTAIHKHPHGTEVAELLCLLRLDMNEGGRTLKDLCDIVASEFDDPPLNLTAAQMEHFLVRYVDAQVIVPPGFWRKGMVQANIKLNAAAEIGKVAEKMQKKWESEEENVGATETNDDGELVPTGPTTKDWIETGSKVISARKEQLDAMARIGMAPERKGGAGVPIVNTQVNVSLREAVGGIRPAIVDVDSKPKPTG